MSSPSLDRALSILSRNFGGRDTLKRASTAFVAVALLRLLANAFIRGIDFKSLPTTLPAPKLVRDGPYPHDIFPGGKFVNTPFGKIRYYEFGPEDGNKLLLVHGISTPAPVWKEMVPGLIAAGHRLLIFDLYGRGYSDTPMVPHDIALYTSQIALLLADLPGWETFDLCGMSLGGPIAANFAYFYPHRIKKLQLICPAGGLDRSKLPFGRRLLMSNLMPSGLMSLLLPLSPIVPSKEKGSLGQWQLSNHKGFMYSFLSSLRHGPIFSNAVVFRSIAETFGTRVEAIWGDDDLVVPMESSVYFDKIKVNIIPGGQHFIMLTHAEEVLKYMVPFLKV
ncbi:alpha/beta-hydrolase [Violaceomyces palustris]|uniref:Alpha/beta-hydrolase n=1 Tax=Violaceomyces palustris TaxID=1673888 RepID=A0ACD0NLF7_9BASI|nr:alpha/beta-hydrolase [Violaceomyces palustris]